MGSLAVIYRLAADIIGSVVKGDTLRFLGATSGQVDVKAPAAPTSWTLTLPTGAPGTSGYVLTGQTDGTTSWAAAGGGSSSWEVSGDFFQIKSASVDTKGVKLNADIADGAAAVAAVIDNTVALTTSGALLLEIRNNSVGVARVDKDGNLTAKGSSGSYDLIFNQSTLGTNWNGYTNKINFFNGDNRGHMRHYGYGSSAFHLFWTSGQGGLLHESSFRLKSGTGEYTARGIFFDATAHYDGDTYITKTANAETGEWRFFYDATEVLNVAARIQTTDATVTTIWDETLADNSVHVIEALVVARRTDSAGRWSGKRRVTVYRAGGGATLESSVETLGTDVANGIAPTVTFDANSNDVRLRVTGESAKTIQWRAFIQKVHSL